MARDQFVGRMLGIKSAGKMDAADEASMQRLRSLGKPWPDLNAIERKYVLDGTKIR